MTIPPGLLRTGDSPELIGETDGVMTYAIWRGQRRSRRIAHISSGQLGAAVPEGLLALLCRTWRSAGSAQAEPDAQTALSSWISQGGGSGASWLTMLLQTGYLVRYQPLAPDGLTPEGTATLYLGLRGVELLRQRRERLDIGHSKWAEVWSDAISALPTDRQATPLLRLQTFLQSAHSAVAAADLLTFPGDSFSPGTHRQQHVQLALDFLAATAARMVSGEVFDWKEIGAHYHPAIGASKQFDAQQARLLELLASVAGIGPAACGLVSLGSLYSLYGAGPLTYSSGGVTRTAPPGQVWSISSDELDLLELAGPQPKAIVLTENRSLLLKMAHTNWPDRRSTLVLGIDGQPREGLLRLLRMLSAPVLTWVDTDAAGLSIGQTLQKTVLHSRWVLPPLDYVPATEMGDFTQWQTRMEARVRIRPMEQETTLGGPVTWDHLLMQAMGREYTRGRPD